jgi:hypothetical protein
VAVGVRLSVGRLRFNQLSEASVLAVIVSSVSSSTCRSSGEMH